VLREAARDREGLGEALDEKVAELERGTNDDARSVQLARNEPAVIAPVEQAVPATFDDAV